MGKENKIEIFFKNNLPSFSLKRILLLIVLLFAFYIRMQGISNPLLDTHSWRQTQTAMFARNLYRNHLNIFLPEVDWNGKDKGYIESEFQLYPFIVAVFYKIFGVQEVIGKFVALLFFIASLYYLFLLVKFLISYRIALLTIIFCSFSPLSVFFSQAFMPESAMLFFSVISLYHFVKFCEQQKNIDFYLSIILLTITFLVKIPTLYLGLPLFYFAFKKYSFNLFKEKKLYVLTFVVLLITFLWYFYANKLGKTTGLTENIWAIGKDKWGNISHWTNKDFYKLIIGRLQYLTLTPILVPFFAIGIFVNPDKKSGYFFHYYLLAVIIYFFVTAYGNMVHTYYQLPFMFPAFVLTAKGLNIFLEKYFYENLIGKKYLIFLFLTILLITDIFYSKRMISSAFDVNWNYLKAAIAAKNVVLSEEIILVIDDSYPEVLYYSDRKGYHIDINSYNLNTIKDFIRKGTQYLVVSNKNEFLKNPQANFVSKKYKLIKEGDTFLIYKLF